MRDDVSKCAANWNLVSQIKAFAKFQPVPGHVYAASQIPEPLSSSPSAPSGKPTYLQIAQPTAMAALRLSWAANSTAGTAGRSSGSCSCQVKLICQHRRPPAAAPAATSRHICRYHDPRKPAAHRARYLVQGFRGNRAGRNQ